MPTTNSVPLSTSALAASTEPRRGVAASVARIIPVPYSLVTTSVPSTMAVIWANIIPQVTNEPGRLVGLAAGQPLGAGRADQHGQAGAEDEQHHGRPDRRADRPELDPLGAQRVGEARAGGRRGRSRSRVEDDGARDIGDGHRAIPAVRGRVVLHAVGGQRHEGVLEGGPDEGQLVQEQAAPADELADGGGVEALDAQLLVVDGDVEPLARAAGRRPRRAGGSAPARRRRRGRR